MYRKAVIPEDALLSILNHKTLKQEWEGHTYDGVSNSTWSPERSLMQTN